MLPIAAHHQGRAELEYQGIPASYPVALMAEEIKAPVYKKQEFSK